MMHLMSCPQDVDFCGRLCSIRSLIKTVTKFSNLIGYDFSIIRTVSDRTVLAIARALECFITIITIIIIINFWLEFSECLVFQSQKA